MTTESPSRTYNDLEKAFKFFNEALFDATLPPVLITMQRRPGSLGYYRNKGMHDMNDGKSIVDEIALNPQHFQRCGLQDTLSTLVHEMAHMWQAHHGAHFNPGAHHNAEWSKKMLSIGLIPSDTGKVGGKMTGQKMDHYIAKGGLFQKAYARYTERNDVRLYQDALTLNTSKLPKAVQVAVAAAKSAAGKKAASKTKFSCVGCGQNGWAKPTALLCCGVCAGRPFMQPDTSSMRHILA